MGYVADRPLSALFDDDEVDVFAREVAERAADRLLELVRAFTPVARESDGGRAPGTTRRSWRSVPVTSRGDSFVVEVFSDDEIAFFLEYGTRPHVIRPRADRAPASVVESGRPRRAGTDPAARLRFKVGGRVVYAREVHHPGTRPYRMMGRALAQLQNEIPMIAREVEARGGR